MTMPECSAAVAVSHGSSDAFSTGSHAQYPPQPRTSYAHQPPSMMAMVRKIHGSKSELRSGRRNASPSRPRRSAAVANPNGIVIPTYPRYRNGGGKDKQGGVLE